MIVIFLGPPGSGKGTQSALLSSKFGLKHLSIGQLLREEYEKKTPLGLEGEKYWGQKGINVPTRISFPLLEKHLSDKTGVVLDNFPRTKENLSVLTSFLKKNSLQVDFAFHLNIDKEESYERLLKRAKSDKEKFGAQRKDETEELIRIRQNVGYEKEIEPIISFYREQKVLYEIEGRGSISDIHEQIVKILKNYGQQTNRKN
ncbi:nucleoside monophosphate kinase [Candidatus Microgenomates bacterium]|nr:nucleoside monophosphate kinase [Candidatus Microgenomates bacterium]